MPWLYWLAAAVVGYVMLRPKTVLAYVRGQARQIELGSIGDGFQLRADAAAAFIAMAHEARQAGITLKVNSAFRRMEEQQQLFDRYKAGTGNLAATPGHSNHQSGIAVDIQVGGVFDSITYMWLKNNAPRFGFVNTGANFKSQPEPWHWEYLK